MLQKLKKISLFVFAICLVGCATAYKPKGLNGGYSDIALGEDIYKVTFYGNRYTSAEQVENLLLKRCAEITLNNDYRYFVILDSKLDVEKFYSQSSTNITTSTPTMTRANSTISPGNTMVYSTYTNTATIRMYKDNKTVPEAFDSAALIK